MPIEPTMTIAGKPATSDDWIEVRNRADLNAIVGRYPNGSAAHADIDNAFAVGSRLEAGTTWVNSHNLASSDVDGPFGGYKESGIGQDFGRETGLWQYTQYKTISDGYHGA